MGWGRNGLPREHIVYACTSCGSSMRTVPGAAVLLPPRLWALWYAGRLAQPGRAWRACTLSHSIR